MLICSSLYYTVLCCPIIYYTVLYCCIHFSPLIPYAHLPLSLSQILGNNECIEPYTSNMYVRRVRAGEFIVVNPHLLDDLVERGLWTKEVSDSRKWKLSEIWCNKNKNKKYDVGNMIFYIVYTIYHMWCMMYKV